MPKGMLRKTSTGECTCGICGRSWVGSSKFVHKILDMHVKKVHPNIKTKEIQEFDGVRNEHKQVLGVEHYPTDLIKKLKL